MRRHEIDSRVLRIAENNSISSAANGGVTGCGGVGATGRAPDRDRDKERSPFQRLESIIEWINCSRYR